MTWTLPAAVLSLAWLGWKPLRQPQPPGFDIIGHACLQMGSEMAAHSTHLLSHAHDSKSEVQHCTCLVQGVQEAAGQQASDCSPGCSEGVAAEAEVQASNGAGQEAGGKNCRCSEACVGRCRAAEALAAIPGHQTGEKQVFICDEHPFCFCTQGVTRGANM